MPANPKAITSTSISDDGGLRCDPDSIFEAEAITTSAITSDEFLLGQTMAGVQIKVTANASMTLPQDEVLTFEFQTSDVSGGTFTTYATRTITGGTGGTVFAADDELFNYVVDRELSERLPSKVVITPDTTSLASSVNAYLVFIS